jgi:hypothetical protein
MYGGINMTYLIIFFLIDSRIFKADNISSIFFVIGIRISVGCGIEGLRNFLCILRKASHVSRYLPSDI